MQRAATALSASDILPLAPLSTYAELQHDLERLVGGWRLDSRRAQVEDPQRLAASIRAICTILERRQIFAAFVSEKELPGSSERVLTTDQSSSHRPLLERIFAEAKGTRLLVTPRDAKWQELATDTSALGEKGWAACEPVETKDGARSSLVTFADDDTTRDTALLALPNLARAIAIVLEEERASKEASVFRHALNNSLATVLSNVDYAASIVEEFSDALPDVAQEALTSAVNNAREGVRRSTALLKQQKERSRR